MIRDLISLEETNSPSLSSPQLPIALRLEVSPWELPPNPCWHVNLVFIHFNVLLFFKLKPRLLKLQITTHIFSHNYSDNLNERSMEKLANGQKHTGEHQLPDRQISLKSSLNSSEKISFSPCL